MASKIQKPNLKINEIVLKNIKLNTKIAAITPKLMAETPNIKSTNADNNSAANSNMMFLKIKNAKPPNHGFALNRLKKLVVNRVTLFRHVLCHRHLNVQLQQFHLYLQWLLKKHLT